MSERLNNIANLVSKRTGTRVVYQVIHNRLVIGDTKHNTLIYSLNPVLDLPDTTIIDTITAEYMIFLDKKLKEKRYAENCIYTWKDCKDKIKFRLINIERDEYSLQNKAYKHFLNFVKVYYIDFEDEYFAINNDMLKQWNITIDELDKVAEFNVSQEMIEIKTDKKIDETGCVLRVRSMSSAYGSSVLVLPNFLQYLENLYYNTGEDVYVIPYRANELLIYVGTDISFISLFMKSNSNILSKRFYKYDSELKNLIIM